jgi:DNA-binding NtrC family response regulator
MINVLCVEDHFGMARLIQLILEREGQGFNVTHVTYLAEALEIASNDAIDVILLDLNLPDSLGIDSLSKLHALVPKIPIIVMTGLGDQEINDRVVQEGACDFLIKGDFDAKFLSQKILGVLES